MDHPPRASLALCCAVLLGGAAQAEPNPYYLGVSESVQHDGNLLRLPDGVQPTNGFVQADTIMSTSLLGGFDQNISRQHLFGNLTLRDDRFRNNDILNNHGYTAAGGADWESAERLSGNLRLVGTRNLASFSSQVGFVPKRNIETTRQLDTTVRVGAVTAFTVEGGAGYRSVDYSAEEYNRLEFRENRVSLGGRWRPDGATSAGLGVRESRGRYPKFGEDADGFVADRYTRRDLDLDASVVGAGASDLLARLSLGQIRYEQSTQRDFTGVTGVLRWIWRPTGKLRLDTSLTRDPGQDSYFQQYFGFNPDGSFGILDGTVEFSRITNAFRVQAEYQASGKISLDASFGLSRRSLAATSTANPGAPLNGSDHGQNYGFGAVWTPLRSLQFGCSWNHDLRRGGAPLSSDFSDTTYSCYGQFTLQ